MTDSTPTHCDVCKKYIKYKCDFVLSIRSNEGVVFCCKICCSDKVKEKKACYYCKKDSVDEYDFTLNFVNLNTATTVKLCSAECRLKELEYTKSCGQDPSFGLLSVCNTCSNTKERMKKCSRCKYVRYCDEICQKKDWKDHKKICKYVRKEKINN